MTSADIASSSPRDDANAALAAALAVTAIAAVDAGRRVVLSTGAGYPSLSALP